MAGLVTSIVLALALPLYSDGGRVVMAGTGRPVPGADVIVLGARGSARTDAEGRFLWPIVTLPATVIVMLPDGRLAKPIRLDTTDRLDGLTLEVEPALVDTVVVRGAAPDVDSAPGASRATVTAADLALRQPATLAQALEHLPGVSWIGEGQGATPAIRGLARGRTLVLVDGARVSAERGAGPNASFLDPGTLARVDVARGPGSVAYGSDALGGVIAARTRRPDLSAPLAVRIDAAAGAGVPEGRAAVELSRGYTRGGLLVGARMRAFDDYASPDGVVPYSGWRDAGVRAEWDQTQGSGLWSVGWQTDVARDIGRPRGDSDAVVATSPFERSHRLMVSFERASLGAWREIRVDAFGGAGEQRTEQDRLPAPGRPRRLDRADVEARDLQARLTGRRPVGRVGLHVGADLQGRYGLSSTDTAFVYNAAGALASTVTSQSIESAHRTGLGLFAEADILAARWMRLVGGLRGDGVRSVNEGGYFGDRSIARQALSGVAAVTVTPAASLSLTAQAARGFREPTLTDRFARGPVGRGFVEGNPDLEPETSRQFDVTVRYVAGPVQISAAGYWYEITNLVERYAAGADLFRIRNRGRARLRGLELETRLEIQPSLSIDVTAQATDGRDAIDGTPLDDVAPLSVGVVLRHAWRRLSSSFATSAVAADTRAGPSEVPAPGYTLVNLAAAWRITSSMDVRATMRNASDARYPSSAGPRWVLAPGRQVLVAFSARW